MKKTLLLFAVFAAFLTGCGTGSGDTRYIDGNTTFPDLNTSSVVSMTDVGSVSNTGDGLVVVCIDGAVCSITVDNSTDDDVTISDVNNTDNTSAPTVVEQPQPVIVTYTTPVSVQL